MEAEKQIERLEKNLTKLRGESYYKNLYQSETSSEEDDEKIDESYNR